MDIICSWCSKVNGKRKTVCTNKPCPASCGTFGEVHYRTFDGVAYDFKGVCVYTMVSVKITPNINLIFFIWCLTRRKILKKEASTYKFKTLLAEILEQAAAKPSKFTHQVTSQEILKHFTPIISGILISLVRGQQAMVQPNGVIPFNAKGSAKFRIYETASYLSLEFSNPGGLLFYKHFMMFMISLKFRCFSDVGSCYASLHQSWTAIQGQTQRIVW